MQIASAIEQIESKYRSLAPVLTEQARRHWAAAEARAYGWGGVSAVGGATGMSPNTIRKGLAELVRQAHAPDAERTSRLRKPGGGRKRLTETDPQLSVALDRLVAPLTRGDPQSPLRRTCKSTRHLAHALSRQGHPISARAVAQLLNAAGYSLQGNRKTLEGTAHPTATRSSNTSTPRSSGFSDPFNSARADRRHSPAAKSPHSHSIVSDGLEARMHTSFINVRHRSLPSFLPSKNHCFAWRGRCTRFARQLLCGINRQLSTGAVDHSKPLSPTVALHKAANDQPRSVSAGCLNALAGPSN